MTWVDIRKEGPSYIENLHVREIKTLLDKDSFTGRYVKFKVY